MEKELIKYKVCDSKSDEVLSQFESQEALFFWLEEKFGIYIEEEDE